jgi:hypothetical protein
MALLELASPLCVLLPFASSFEPAAFLLIYLHPAGAVLGVTRAGSLGGFGQFGWISATVASFAVSAWLLRSSGRQLFDFASRVEEPDADLTEERGLLAPGAAVRPWVTETRVWDHEPLVWKELATRPGARLESLLGYPLLWWSAALLVFLWLATDGISTLFLLLTELVVLTAVVILGSGLFVRDRETRWNEMVLCSPLSSFAILRAKLISGLIAPESRYILGMGTAVLLGWTLRLGVFPCLFALLTAAFFVLFAYLLAAFSSLIGRTIRGAFVGATAALILLLLLLPSDSVWVDPHSLFNIRQAWSLESYASSLNPLIFLYSNEEVRGNGLRPDGPVFALLFFMAAYAGAAIVLLGMIGWTYHRMRRRK